MTREQQTSDGLELTDGHARVVHITRRGASAERRATGHTPAIESGEPCVSREYLPTTCPGDSGRHGGIMRPVAPVAPDIAAAAIAQGLMQAFLAVPPDPDTDRLRRFLKRVKCLLPDALFFQ